MKSVAIDRLLLVAVFALIGIGIVIIYSASSPSALEAKKEETYFVLNHLVKLLVGVALFLVTIQIDYAVWMKYSRLLFIVSFVMMLALLVGPWGVKVHGATRWLNLGGLKFQPSELMKISMIFLLATKLSECKDQIEDLKIGFLRPLIIVGVVFGLLILQPNYSTALLVVVISTVMFFVAGVPTKHMLAVGGPGFLFVSIFAFSSEYRLKRVMSWLEQIFSLFGSNTRIEGSYQVTQALTSLGSGGMFGAGLGEGTQKLGYLPMPFTDTVFASLGEEMGFIGTFLVMALFGIIAWRGISIASKVEPLFGRLVVVGFTASLFINAFFHIGVCTSLIPPTGQPLPLVGYGGTNLILNLFALGVILNISKSSNEARGTQL
ncbi:MAG: putative lipid II flippase FtsW [Fibrobacterales bacterium]